MLWLALHLPLLSLEAWCQTLTAEQRARPLALLDQHRTGPVNAVAAERGIKPGMKRATAMALSGELLFGQADAHRDAAALLAVAHVALACTPSVTLHDEQTVLLEVQPSLRLFGGLAALRRKLLGDLAPLGHRVHSAAAPTPLGASLLARWRPDSPDEPAAANAQARPSPRTSAHAATGGAAAGRTAGTTGDTAAGTAAGATRGATGPSKPSRPTAAHVTDLSALQQLLDAAPVWLLGPGREHWEALQGMGLHTIADLRQLPRGGLVRRFGAVLLDELDRARGERPDPRSWITLPPVFESRLELYERAENTDQVLSAAAVLLARLVAWAQARQARVAAYTLAMQHERNRQTLVPATELHIELAEPALDPAHLQLLLRERLARVELAAPTLELRLHCSHVTSAPAPNGELFVNRSTTTEGLTRLLERLRARLGDDQVQRLVAVADHRPECASRYVPAQGAAVSSAVGATTLPDDAQARAALPLHRPAWLLPDPLPLPEREGLPWLDGRALQLLSGPERIETGWWDEHAVARDYYIAQTADDSLVWVFRSRVPDAETGAVPWFLQGRFA